MLCRGMAKQVTQKNTGQSRNYRDKSLHIIPSSLRLMYALLLCNSGPEFKK
jgi:hypothetical protein